MAGLFRFYFLTPSHSQAAEMPSLFAQIKILQNSGAQLRAAVSSRQQKARTMEQVADVLQQIHTTGAFPCSSSVFS